MKKYWWRDPEELVKQYELHDRSLQKVVYAHDGVPSYKTILDWWKKSGLPELPRGERKAVVTRVGADSVEQLEADENQLLSALKKFKDAATVLDLADEADLSPRRVKQAADSLREKGYELEQIIGGTSPADNLVKIDRLMPPTEETHEIMFEGDTYRFGVAGDTHLGSKEECLDELNIAYDRFKAEGIEHVYHPGDLVCGIGIYKGQGSDIKLTTMDDQIDYAVANFPQREGVETRIISGNHDLEGEASRIGVDPVRAVCNQRDDMTHYGRYKAWIVLQPWGTKIYMVHPKGGSAYARSYKLQKFAESFEQGKKPNVLIAGHYHDALYMPERGIHMLKSGCFESGGDLGVRLPLKAPIVGFWIVEMTVQADGSVVRFKPELFQFYPGRVPVSDEE